MFRFSPLALLLSLVLAGFASADHGPVLAAAIEVAPGVLKDTTDLKDTRNYVFRGRVVSLGNDRSVSVCYDTEHMRIAGAWVGKPVAYISDRNMGPAVNGSMLFATRPGPGWARDGKFNDPRPHAEGPLPREWAHFKAQFLHGDRVVFAYTVAEADVLESPGIAMLGARPVITRTLNIGPSTRPSEMLVWHEPGTKATLNNDNLVTMEIDGERLVAGMTGLSARDASWNIVDGRVSLRWQASAKGTNLRIAIARLPRDESLAPFVGLLKNPVEDLRPLTRGGPPRWETPIITKGTPGTAKPNDKLPYVMDEIGLPTPNPWKASIRFTGLDFFPDGRAALCTWDGDVWIASGLDENLRHVSWRRFAAGLQQPLGLKIIDGVIFTAGRDQVTKLIDLNTDGEADLYQNFNNDAGLTLQRHEFVMNLETDAEGNLYFGRSGHYIASKNGDNCCLMKLSSDGGKLDIVARGFREPNGLSIGPDGTILIADNEGNGVPQTPIYRVTPGRFYGYTPAKTGKGGTWKQSEPPILWLPKLVDRSAGSQVWAPKSWGPLGGLALHTSYGHCALFALLIDSSVEPWQAAAWKLPVPFQSGIMRARFHPGDHQLYVAGLRGWDTNAVKDGQFARIRFTGSKLPVPVGIRVVKAGLEVTFSGPLDRDFAEDDQNWAGDWSERPLGPKAKPADLPIESATLSPDGKSVTIHLERLMPVMNYNLQFNIKSADGAPIAGTLHGTINRVP